VSNVLHRHTRADLPTAVGGDGVYLIDSQGKRYLDGSGGAAVSCIGHGNQEIIAAIKAQADKIAYAHTSFFTSEAAEELADFLIPRSSGMAKAYFVSGGSEAVEAALKLARQYFIERGETQRRHFIARRQSYHGNTLGALAVGGNRWRRAQFEPMLIEAHHIAPCYAYRDQSSDESTWDYGQRVANELEQKVSELGGDTVIAFIAEPVVGATVGAVPAVPGYFQRIRKICDRHGILLILDEVMCGMGRTGTLFASEQEDIQPDIVTIAKGLGAGYQPIGATLLSADIYAALEAGTGFFQHGHTYLGHPMACATALAVQRLIERDRLLDNVRTKGELLIERLRQQFASHPYVGDIRGRGLFVGLEFVADRQTKVPFDAALAVHQILKRRAMDAGLMCYPGSGTIDGQNGHHILLAPPYIVEEKHIDELVEKLTIAIQQTFDEIGV
jgi:adenosylmethionine-8-amino-7-oxononanoate aminotransferase